MFILEKQKGIEFMLAPALDRHGLTAKLLPLCHLLRVDTDSQSGAAIQLELESVKKKFFPEPGNKRKRD